VKAAGDGDGEGEERESWELSLSYYVVTGLTAVYHIRQKGIVA
jgi:hypothetical protein